MAPKVSRGFKRHSDDKTVSFASTVHERMSSDVQFVALKPFVDDIKVKKDALVTGMALALRKDQDRKDEKKILKQNLMNLLEKIARKLEDLVEENGDNARIITDAGFEIRTNNKTEKVAITELDIPENVEAKNLKKTGSVLLTWDEVANAINYAIRYKAKSENVWQSGFFNNKGNYTFNNLQSDTVYEFEVWAIGPNGITSEYVAAVPVYVS